MALVPVPKNAPKKATTQAEIERQTQYGTPIPRGADMPIPRGADMPVPKKVPLDLNATTQAEINSQIQYGTPVEAKDRELRGIETLSDLYGGVDYDREAIEGVFQDATTAKYNAQRKEYNRSMQQYYDRLGTSQNAYLDMLRQEKGRAINSGYTRGTMDANALSAMLGMSQQTAADNLTLTQQDRALTDQEAAERAKNAQLALEYSNDQKNKIAALDSGLYAADTQKYVGELGANAQIGSANIAASAQGYASDVAAEAQRYASDKNLEGQKITAAAQQAAASASAAANKYAAELGFQGQQAALQANLIQQQMADTASIVNSSTIEEATDRLMVYLQGNPLGSGQEDFMKSYLGQNSSVRK